MDNEDFCCGCAEPMPESVAEWWLDEAAHMYCSEWCAQQGPRCFPDGLGNVTVTL